VLTSYPCFRKNVIISRRLNYLKHIPDRPDQELIRRVYQEQKKNPSKGDWTELVKADIEKIEFELNEDEINLLKKKNSETTSKPFYTNWL
jgi:rRNA maturation endonuclease Nob1